MEKGIESAVRARAQGVCEYCHFPQQYAEFRFVIDHIIARQHGGPTTPENLALACGPCNRQKGPNIAGLGPADGALTRTA
jgi:5-methylcytosine-specific restriction endonuclease McrA